MVQAKISKKHELQGLVPHGTVWWKRLLAALASTCLTLGVGSVLATYRSAAALGEHHWGNGGLEQIFGFVVLIGGVAAAALFLFVEMPLVLLIPVSIQQRYWHMFLLFAAFVGPLALECVTHPTASRLWMDLRHEPGFLLISLLSGLFSCGVYFFMLFRMNPRPVERPSAPPVSFDE